MKILVQEDTLITIEERILINLNRNPLRNEEWIDFD